MTATSAKMFGGYLMQWLNEPADWSENERTVQFRTLAKTDFWRQTHYGFVRDTGHFYFTPVHGDFVVETRFEAQYRDLYDQAGLMVRQSPEIWCKAGIEYVHGHANLSAVVTRDFSDWSVTELDQVPATVGLRITRVREALTIEAQLPGSGWKLLRLAYLTEAAELEVGLMAASPEGDGFDVAFRDWQLKPAG